MNEEKGQKSIELLRQLRVCVSDIDILIQRIQLLSEELAEWRKLPAEKQIDPANLKNSVSFAELRQFDIRCHQTLECSFPELAENWYINQDQELGSENEVLTHLQRKKGVLQNAINNLIIENDLEESLSNKEQKEDIVDIKPNFFGIGLNLNAFMRWVKGKKSKKGKDGDA